MSRSSFLAANSHGRRPHLVEVLLPTIVSKHAHLCLAIIEEDRLRPTMDPMLVDGIVLRPPLEEAHRRGGMEVVHPQEIVT